MDDTAANGGAPGTGGRRGVFGSRWFSYLFLVSLAVYLLVCGYVLVFSGSLFIEAVAKGWYKASASEYDSDSFMLGYLYGFASLMGVIGSIVIFSTRPRSYFRIKVLLIFPSAIWSVLLVLDVFRWGLEYWTQLLYLMPIMLLCLFIFTGVVKQAAVPYFIES